MGVPVVLVVGEKGTGIVWKSREFFFTFVVTCLSSYFLFNKVSILIFLFSYGSISGKAL